MEDNIGGSVGESQEDIGSVEKAETQSFNDKKNIGAAKEEFVEGCTGGKFGVFYGCAGA